MQSRHHRESKISKKVEKVREREREEINKQAYMHKLYINMHLFYNCLKDQLPRSNI